MSLLTGIDQKVSILPEICGPNMMVRRRVFDQRLRFNTDIGPTGSNYVMGSETEFIQRASNADFTAFYAPSAFIYHQIRPEQLTHAFMGEHSVCVETSFTLTCRYLRWKSKNRCYEKSSSYMPAISILTYLEQKTRNWRAELNFTKCVVIYISVTKVAIRRIGRQINSVDM